MHRFVALTRAILIRALMNPRTIEKGFSHSSASNFASLLRNARASKPNIPSVDTTKGVKWRRWFSQGLQYFFFFSFSCRSRAFLGDRFLSRFNNSFVLLCITLTFISLHSYGSPCQRGSVLVSVIRLNRSYLELCSDLQLFDSLISSP